MNMLDEKQAARFLGLAPSTLRKWRALGTGPRFYKIGDTPRARVRYKEDDLREFVGEPKTNTLRVA